MISTWRVWWSDRRWPIAYNHRSAVLIPVDEATWISTNAAAQSGLAAIQDLALVGQWQWIIHGSRSSINCVDIEVKLFSRSDLSVPTQTSPWHLDLHSNLIYLSIEAISWESSIVIVHLVGLLFSKLTITLSLPKSKGEVDCCLLVRFFFLLLLVSRLPHLISELPSSWYLPWSVPSWVFRASPRVSGTFEWLQPFPTPPVAGSPSLLSYMTFSKQRETSLPRYERNERAVSLNTEGGRGFAP